MAGERPVALVTGASSGIGRGLALRLARDGYAVGLLARRAGHLREVAAEIGERGGTASVHRCDVSERAQVLHAVEDCSAELGPVDVLVANAGMGSHMHVDELNGDEVELVMRVNFLGAVHAVEALLPTMLSRGSGHSGGGGQPGGLLRIAQAAGLLRFQGGHDRLLREPPPGPSPQGDCRDHCKPRLRSHRDDRGRGIGAALHGGTGARPWTESPRAIRARRRSLAFPWQIALPAAVARSLPPALFDFVARRIRH